MIKKYLLLFTIVCMIALSFISCSCNKENKIEDNTESSKLPLTDIYSHDENGKINPTDNNGKEIHPTDYYGNEFISFSPDGYPVYENGEVSKSLYGDNKEPTAEINKQIVTDNNIETKVTTNPTSDAHDNEIDAEDIF